MKWQRRHMKWQRSFWNITISLREGGGILIFLLVKNKNSFLFYFDFYPPLIYPSLCFLSLPFSIYSDLGATSAQSAGVAPLEMALPSQWPA